MKILVITSSFLPKIGGAEIAIHNLAEGLISLGHTVYVLSSNSGHAQFKRNYILKKYYTFKGMYKLRILEVYLSFVFLVHILRIKPHVIHVHFSWPTGYALSKIRKILPKIPIVITTHGEDIQRKPEINYGYRLNEKLNRKISFSLKSMDAAIAVGTDIVHEYCNIGVDKNRVHFLPNSINYTMLRKSDEMAREKLSIPVSKFVILAVGRNHPKKGFDKLVASIQILSLKYPFIFCCIVGKDVSKLKALPFYHEIEDKIKLVEAADPVGIEFVNSNRENILTYFQAANMYAMSSLIESMGLVTVEALSTGLPVIAFDGPGTKDIVKNGINGLLVTDFNERAFARAIETLINDQDLYKKLKSNAAKSGETYDRILIAKKHEKIYIKTISELQKHKLTY
jgi:glycosyltransferase involved in cell wall biosynthesis